MSKAPQQRIDIVNIITNFSGKDNNIVIPRPFLVWCGGDLGISLFLSECLYWSDKTKDAQGWFARTAEEWQQATTLVRESIDRAYVTLAPLGLQREVKRSQWHDFVPVLHYRFNQDMLRDAATAFFSVGVSLKIASSKETRAILAEESKRKKLLKSETGLCLEHESDCASNTNHEMCLEHESYKETSREYEESIKEIAPATQAQPVTDPLPHEEMNGSALKGQKKPAHAENSSTRKTQTAKDTTPPSKVAPKVSPAPRALTALEREIMTEFKNHPRSRVTPTEENMGCAAKLCEDGLMICEKLNGKAIYSLTDQGRKALIDKPPPKVNAAEALAAAMGLTPVGDDWARFGRVASKLLKSKAIAIEEFKQYVEYWTHRSQEEHWRLTVDSLVGGVRMSEYVQWRSEHPMRDVKNQKPPAPEPDPSEYVSKERFAEALKKMLPDLSAAYGVDASKGFDL